MKKLFLILAILILIPVLSFSQSTWMFLPTGEAVNLLEAVPTKAKLILMNAKVGTKILLSANTTTEYGAGIFTATTSAASVNTENVFAHPATGVVWIRDQRRGSGTFTGTELVDTVLIAGALTTDFYLVTGTGGAVDPQDVLQPEALAGTLIVHRVAAGKSALTWDWVRIP